MLDSTYTIASDKIDSSPECLKRMEDLNCIGMGQACTEGPETRKINGLDVFKECWAWKTDYSCASTDLTSTCEELEKNPLCEESASRCIDVLPGGECGLLERQFKCAETPSSSTPTTTTQTDCGTQSFCIDGSCFDTGYPPDNDFGLVIATMEAVREAANYAIFKGEANSCGNNLINSCCKSKGGGLVARNDSIATQLGSEAVNFGWETVKVYGSYYMFDGLVPTPGSLLGALGKYAVPQMVTDIGLMGPAGEQIATDLLAGTATTVDFMGFGFAISMGEEGLSIAFTGFDPTSFMISLAIMAIKEMMKCEEEDEILAMKRGQGLCHKVGSYCGNKVMGTCTDKREGWCCYPSKLGRIINEQGLPQLGRDFGDAESPNCDGFTIDELTLLRFDEMDLSEFINDIMPAAKTPEYAIERLNEKVQSYYGN